MTLSNIKSSERSRALHAYKAAKRVEDGKYLTLEGLPETAVKKFKFSKKEFQSYAKKLPMMIKTNGLAAALAFFNTKKDSNPHREIYLNIKIWLKDELKLVPEETPDLFPFILERKSDEYRALTVEVLSYLNWLRRFADGVITEEENNAEKEDKNHS